MEGNGVCCLTLLGLMGWLMMNMGGSLENQLIAMCNMLPMDDASCVSGGELMMQGRIDTNSVLLL